MAVVHLHLADPLPLRTPTIREALEARVHDCCERLDDAISELRALHGVDEELILRRVRLALARESACADS